jgi:hypothetical protein
MTNSTHDAPKVHTKTTNTKSTPDAPKIQLMSNSMPSIPTMPNTTNSTPDGINSMKNMQTDKCIMAAEHTVAEQFYLLETQQMLRLNTGGRPQNRSN